MHLNVFVVLTSILAVELKEAFKSTNKPHLEPSCIFSQIVADFWLPTPGLCLGSVPQQESHCDLFFSPYELGCSVTGGSVLVQFCGPEAKGSTPVGDQILMVFVSSRNHSLIPGDTFKLIGLAQLVSRNWPTKKNQRYCEGKASKLQLRTSESFKVPKNFCKGEKTCSHSRNRERVTIETRDSELMNMKILSACALTKQETFSQGFLITCVRTENWFGKILFVQLSDLEITTLQL